MLVARVLAEAIEDDFVFQVVRDPQGDDVHTVIARRTDGVWRFRGGSHLGGALWVNDGTDRDLGILGFGGRSSAATVTIEFEGEEFVVPVTNGHFAWLHWEVPPPTERHSFPILR